MNDNNKRHLIISIVIGFATGIVFSVISQNIQAFPVISFFVFLAVIFYFFAGRCGKCGNLNAINKTNQRTLGTDTKKSYFSREERVGTDVRRNYHGEVVGETAVYRIVNYVTETTYNTVEDTFECKFCHNRTTDIHKVKVSSVTRRCGGQSY